MATFAAKRGLNLLGMVIMVVTFALGTIYATIAFSAQDVFWFVNSFQERPDRIVIHHEGQQTELLPGQPGYYEVAEAIRLSLDEGVYRQSGVGLSDQSLQDAYEVYVTVEAFFDEPVKLHGGFYTGHPTQMLIPITGRHSNLSIVVLGENGKYRSNAPALRTLQPLRDALKSLGIIPS